MVENPQARERLKAEISHYRRLRQHGQEASLRGRMVEDDSRPERPPLTHSLALAGRVLAQYYQSCHSLTPRFYQTSQRLSYKGPRTCCNTQTRRLWHSRWNTSCRCILKISRTTIISSPTRVSSPQLHRRCPKEPKHRFRSRSTPQRNAKNSHASARSGP